MYSCKTHIHLRRAGTPSDSLKSWFIPKESIPKHVPFTCIYILYTSVCPMLATAKWYISLSCLYILRTFIMFNHSKHSMSYLHFYGLIVDNRIFYVKILDKFLKILCSHLGIFEITCSRLHWSFWLQLIVKEAHDICRLYRLIRNIRSKTQIYHFYLW
jgi:hypothetical protein